MSGEAYRVHDEVMAVLRDTCQAVKSIERLTSAWGDAERHRYLEEHLTKISLAISALLPATSSLTDLFNKINMASTTPVVPRRPVLRVVNGGLPAWAGEGEV